MTNNMEDVSVKAKLKLNTRILTLARLVQSYEDRPKNLKLLDKIVKGEIKELKSTRYPISDKDLNQIQLDADSLKRIMVRLKKAKKPEVWAGADKELQQLIDKLTEAVTPKTDKVINNIKTAVNNAAKSLGDMESSLADKLSDKVNQIKKSIVGGGSQ